MPQAGGSDNREENCIRTSLPIHTVHQILRNVKKGAGHVLSMGEMRTVFTVLVRKHKTKILLEGLGIEKIILKWI